MPLFMILITTFRDVNGTWYFAAVVFSVLVVALFAALLRQGAREIAKGLLWSVVAFLPASLVLWSLVHLPAH